MKNKYISESVRKLNNTLIWIQNQNDINNRTRNYNNSQRDYKFSFEEWDSRNANYTFINGIRHNNSQSVINPINLNMELDNTLIINKKSPKKYILKESINGLKYKQCFKGVSHLSTGAKNVLKSLENEDKSSKSEIKRAKNNCSSRNITSPNNEYNVINLNERPNIWSRPNTNQMRRIIRNSILKHSAKWKEKILQDTKAITSWLSTFKY